MKRRSTKIIVDILMTIFLILSFIRWDGIGGAIYHIIVGGLCAVFFAIHICIHRKWIIAVTKSVISGKINKALKSKYIIDMLLIIVWGISIITGIFAIAPFLAATSVGASGLGRIHGITARIGAGIVAIHAVQHLPQIKSYLGIKTKRKKQK